MPLFPYNILFPENLFPFYGEFRRLLSILPQQMEILMRKTLLRQWRVNRFYFPPIWRKQKNLPHYGTGRTGEHQQKKRGSYPSISLLQDAFPQTDPTLLIKLPADSSTGKKYPLNCIWQTVPEIPFFRKARVSPEYWHGKHRKALLWR